DGVKVDTPGGADRAYDANEALRRRRAAPPSIHGGARCLGPLLFVCLSSVCSRTWSAAHRPAIPTRPAARTDPAERPAARAERVSAAAAVRRTPRAGPATSPPAPAAAPQVA